MYHLTQLFFKTVKCVILLLVCVFIVSQQAAAQAKIITVTVRNNDSAGKPLLSAGIQVR